MIGFIIWIIGVVLCVKAVLEIMKMCIRDSTYPVDTSNPENILAQRVQGTEYTYAPIRPWTARKYFAVTAIDRCGNESEAIQQQ